MHKHDIESTVSLEFCPDQLGDYSSLYIEPVLGWLYLTNNFSIYGYLHSKKAGQPGIVQPSQPQRSVPKAKVL